MHKLSAAAPPVNMMTDDIDLEDLIMAGNSSFIDLNYSQFKKYQELLKESKEQLRSEVYKDHAKLDVKRALFGDDEIRKNMARDRHEAIDFLERRFGKAYSDDDKVRPPPATYTFLVREKSPTSERREKKQMREWNKKQAIMRREQKLAELKTRAQGLDSRVRLFGANNEAAHARDCTDDRDDLYDSHPNKRSFLNRLTPRTGPMNHSWTPERMARPRRMRHLPPMQDLSLRRLTIRIPSILDTRSEPDKSEIQHKPNPLPPILDTELTGVSSVNFQFPHQARKLARIDGDWVAVKERRRASPQPGEEDGYKAVDKWRIFSITEEPPPVSVFVSYPPDGKVQIKRCKRKKK